MTMPSVLDPSQQAAVDYILDQPDQPCIIVTGKAGTGKSTTIAALEERIPIIKAATTGRAALNIGGMTVDSLFSYDRDKGTVRNGRTLDDNMRACPRCIVIDEASMIGKNMADYLEKTSRHYDKQLILVGDWAQASPVKDEWGTTSTLLKDARETIQRLTQVHRQNEAPYLAALDSIRHGIVTAEVRSLMEGRAIGRTPPHGEFIRLYATNKAVFDYNALRLQALMAQLNCPMFQLQAEVTDLRSDEKRQRFPLTETDVERLCQDSVFAHGEEGRFCVGARVVLTQNAPILAEGAPTLADYQNRRWVNGDTGTILSWEPHANDGSLFDGIPMVQVLLDRTKEPMEIWPGVQERKDAHGNAVAQVQGLPLRLGWAMTIHKAQGATVPQAFVDMDSILRHGQGSRHGLAYVALSRTKTLEGLTLSRWINDAVYCAQEVRGFL